MECTLARLEKMAEAARAVRKAVSSSAFMNARGVPLLSSNVSEPRGVVLWELVVEGSALVFEVVETSVVLLLLLGEDDEAGAEARETIFIPVEVLVLAGIKSVVCPRLPGMESRCG